MADIKPQVYKDPRPAEYFDEFHESARRIQPGWIYELVRMAVTPLCLILNRARSIGTENVPMEGPVLLAPNHFSQMDHFYAGLYIRRRIRFMAKSQLFGPKGLTWVLKAGGAFPVRRGHADEEAFETAYAILEGGGCLLVYAEGGRSRTSKLGDPRPGIGRIALETGVPVVPVAIHGSDASRRWKRLHFPKVTTQFGEPMTFPVEARPSRERQLEVATEVFDRVRTMYTALDERGRRSVIRSLKERVPSPTPGRTSAER